MLVSPLKITRPQADLSAFNPVTLCKRSDSLFIYGGLYCSLLFLALKLQIFLTFICFIYSNRDSPYHHLLKQLAAPLASHPTQRSSRFLAVTTILLRLST